MDDTVLLDNTCQQRVYYATLLVANRVFRSSPLLKLAWYPR